MRAFLTIFLAILTLACNSSLSIEDALEKIAKITPIDQDNWEVVEEMGQGNFKSYVLMQFKTDTTHILHFQVENQDINLVYHDIRFVDSEFDFYLTIKSDTLYFYKEDRIDSTRIFLVGEYEYLYRKAKLTSEQSIFYRNHRDSLKSIAGNDLPALPEK